MGSTHPWHAVTQARSVPQAPPTPDCRHIHRRFGSDPNMQIWTSDLTRYGDHPALTSEPILAKRGVHTLLDLWLDKIRDEYNAAMIWSPNKTLPLPTPDPPRIRMTP